MSNSELLHFWGIGDLHYRALPAWDAVHTERLAYMFQDMHALWQEEGPPAFCVSPGDMVETCALENHRLAKTKLEKQLGNIPFYPGVGNHELFSLDDEDPMSMVDTYTTVWEKPVRYMWTVGDMVCIMLDYPGPEILKDPEHLFISRETLSYLDTTLEEYSTQLAIIFLHAPLRNTVLDRDPEHYRDYNSLQDFFAPSNSQEIRDILAQHKNACLFLSGHTHSGWEAPNLICTENLGGHPVTFVNLMSPWYTGTKAGPRVSTDRSTVEYIPDNPDVIPAFSVHVFPQQASIRVRDHHMRQWLKEWVVPLR
jgi:Icc-related predicted phosphoesterase